MPFVLLVLVLLGGGLICLLVINTTLGATSFRVVGYRAAPRWRPGTGLRQQVARGQSVTQMLSVLTSSACGCK